MREIAYVLIAGNPNIRQGLKPHSARDYMKLSTDIEHKIEKPTEEDIKKAQDYGKTLMNGKAETTDRTNLR